MMKFHDGDEIRIFSALHIKLCGGEAIEEEEEDR